MDVDVCSVMVEEISHKFYVLTNTIGFRSRDCVEDDLCGTLRGNGATCEGPSLDASAWS